MRKYPYIKNIKLPNKEKIKTTINDYFDENEALLIVEQAKREKYDNKSTK